MCNEIGRLCSANLPSCVSLPVCLYALRIRIQSCGFYLAYETNYFLSLKTSNSFNLEVLAKLSHYWYLKSLAYFSTRPGKIMTEKSCWPNLPVETFCSPWKINIRKSSFYNWQWCKIRNNFSHVAQSARAIKYTDYNSADGYPPSHTHQWVSWIWHKTIWWWGSSYAGALGNVEHPFIAIASRSTLARSGCTW